MTNQNGHPDQDRAQRFLDLALDRAGQALDSRETVAFERLAREVSSTTLREVEAFERAATAIHLASLRPAPLSADLRRRLVGDGVALLADRPSAPTHSMPSARPAQPPARRSVPPVAWLGWVAAAAALIVAFSLQRPEPEPLSIEERLASAPDARTLPWSATEDPAAAGASGDVVWSTARQAGFMRIRGLAPNDPGEAQYQLWIFDATRTEENPVAGAGAIPVDGGVFDVTAGEVVVPITAKLPVGQPTLFAVTVERPGGVSVSRQERIVLAASVE